MYQAGQKSDEMGSKLATKNRNVAHTFKTINKAQIELDNETRRRKRIEEKRQEQKQIM